MIRLTITLRCKKHPKYRAIHKPRAKCADCEAMYVALHTPFEFLKETFDPETVEVAVERMEA